MSDTAFLERPRRSESISHAGMLSDRWRRESNESIRLPVTPANRERLRHLRARELEVWFDHTGASSESGGHPRRLPMPAADRESTVILLVLGAAALVALVQASSVAADFVDHWQQFRSLVETLVR